MQRIDRLLQKERHKKPQSDLIPIIDKLIAEHSDPAVVSFVRLHHLRLEYLVRNDFEAATAILLQEIQRRPQAPMPLLTLAEQKHFYEGKADEAVAIAARALALADKANEFRRHARAVLLRSASDAGDVELVRTCLREIIELDRREGEIDVGKEDDLLVRAQKLKIEKELLDRYKVFLKAP